MWYDSVRTTVGSTKELYDWILRKLDFHSCAIPDSLIGKHHRQWTNDTASVAREEAMELAQSYVYVGMMLKEFQNFIRDSKPDKEIDLTPYDLHEESKDLKVSPVYVLQAFGDLKPNESSWLVCEALCHSSHVNYVHAYDFRTKDSQHKRWRNLVHAFVHYVNKRSGGKTIIANLDCNIKGELSNLLCFDKKSSCYLAEPEDIQNVFHLFGHHHNCNDVCRMLKLVEAKKKSGKSMKH